MESFDWERFLEGWSREMQNELGFPGATEAQIVQAEIRLGIKLPPSYKAFLRTSNGWFQIGFDAESTKIFSTEEVDWLRLKTWGKETIDIWLQGFQEVSDEDYFRYDEKQDSVYMRAEYLITALAISQEVDGGLYLLNPKIITKKGEWEAWRLGAHLPGAHRYQSFQNLMEVEYKRITKKAYQKLK